MDTLFKNEKMFFGKINRDITIEIATKIGVSLGRYLKENRIILPKILIGIDSKVTSEAISKAIIVGASSAGVNSIYIGFSSISILSFAVKRSSSHFGVMVSGGSDNNEYVGIDILNGDGNYIIDSVRDTIKSAVEDDELLKNYVSKNDDFGTMEIDNSLIDQYVDFIRSQIDLSIPKDRVILIDLANGALSNIFPRFFENYSNVIFIFNKPNGKNSNLSCGTTSLCTLRKATLDYKSLIGISFNGDGTEIGIVDKKGEKIDYDKMAATLAIKHGDKKIGISYYTSKIVENFLIQKGIEVVRSENPNNISEIYKDKTLNFIIDSGGIMLREHLPIGDSILTALTIIKEYINDEDNVLSLLKSIPDYCKVYAFLSLPDSKKDLFIDKKSVIYKYRENINKKDRVDFIWCGTNKLRVVSEAKTQKKAYEISYTACEILEKNLSNLDNL